MEVKSISKELNEALLYLGDRMVTLYDDGSVKNMDEVLEYSRLFMKRVIESEETFNRVLEDRFVLLEDIYKGFPDVLYVDRKESVKDVLEYYREIRHEIVREVDNF